MLLFRINHHRISQLFAFEIWPNTDIKFKVLDYLHKKWRRDLWLTEGARHHVYHKTLRGHTLHYLPSTVLASSKIFYNKECRLTSILQFEVCVVGPEFYHMYELNVLYMPLFTFSCLKWFTCVWCVLHLDYVFWASGLLSLNK